jgi:hypothetical protein
MARQWKRNAPTPEVSSVTECARRYHACAVALARSFGLPMTAAFLQEYHAAISCVYIEAGRAGVRLPPTVPLPPLTPPAATTNGQAPAMEPQAPGSSTTEDVALAPQDRPLADPSANGAVPANGTVVPSPTTIPKDAGLPCGGVLIGDLKPAQLAMLVSKTARLVHDEGERWVPLLASLQAERAARLARGRKPTPTPEGPADVP